MQIGEHYNIPLLLESSEKFLLPEIKSKPLAHLQGPP